MAIDTTSLAMSRGAGRKPSVGGSAGPKPVGAVPIDDGSAGPKPLGALPFEDVPTPSARSNEGDAGMGHMGSWADKIHPVK